MATTLYISASKLKRDTALGSTVDDNLLTPYINISQDRWILPALGTELDEYLKSQIIAGTPLTGSYLTLVNDYLQPALVQFAFCEVAYVVRLRFSNNSVTVPTSEQGSPASVGDINEVVTRSNEIAMFYRERMISFIRNNTATLPQYNQNTGSDLSPSQRNYFGGLNLYPKISSDNQLKALAGALGIKYFNA
jgi:hypothetical protein